MVDKTDPPDDGAVIRASPGPWGSPGRVCGSRRWRRSRGRAGSGRHPPRLGHLAAVRSRPFETYPYRRWAVRIGHVVFGGEVLHALVEAPGQGADPGVGDRPVRDRSVRHHHRKPAGACRARSWPRSTMRSKELYEKRIILLVHRIESETHDLLSDCVRGRRHKSTHRSTRRQDTSPSRSRSASAVIGRGRRERAQRARPVLLSPKVLPWRANFMVVIPAIF